MLASTPTMIRGGSEVKETSLRSVAVGRSGWGYNQILKPSGPFSFLPFPTDMMFH